MKKTAVIYDKWLDSLGGGEMVACHIAQYLENNGYDVTIICRKIIPMEIISQKLNIELKNIHFIELWNDETKLQKLTRNKDLFINISFIDYSVGKAKLNIYYTHFPTSIYSGLRGFLVNNLILPILANSAKPVEFIDQPQSIISFNHTIQYRLGLLTTLAFSYLKTDQTYYLKFFIYHDQLSKSSLKSFSYFISDSKILGQIVKVDHRHNVIKYIIKILPQAQSIYLKLIVKNKSIPIFLIEPHLYLHPNPTLITRFLEYKFYSRLRAGLFENVKLRLSHYQKIIVHSEYVAYWVKKYWHLPAIVLYPPVEILCQTRPIDYSLKKNIICSVGRFFTLGHSKRQDIMIKAFKIMCDRGLTGWELHLAGGLGNEPTSLAYFEKLKSMSAGYPIIFHLNKNRQEIVDLYFKSKIYWHAAGIGQNRNRNPINFEHFGITPVEAMSAGCLPVIFNGGGLPEIIKLLHLDPKIYLFSTIPELVKNTQDLISKNQTFNINIKLLDQYFSISSFQNHLSQIIK